jgi:hypothetical protein
MAKVYNIFLSHSWSYPNAYDGLISLLNNASYFSFKDYSVPKDDPIHNADNEQELYNAIKKQISPCHIILIMAGVYSTYSKWINIEINIAKKGFQSPKPILGIKPWGNTNVSQVVSDNCDDLVGWNTNSIVSAIRKLSI